jgi:IS5 family transposase
MEGVEAKAFLADKAYDTDELLGMLKEADIAAIISPVKSRKEQRAYSRELYRTRHVIENVFRALKRRWGIAAQSSPLPSSPPFMSGVYSSIFQSALPRVKAAQTSATVALACAKVPHTSAKVAQTSAMFSQASAEVARSLRESCEGVRARLLR